MSNIIPFPAELELRPGKFRLTPETEILTDDSNRWNADY
jgi:hypothetical protein